MAALPSRFELSIEPEQVPSSKNSTLWFAISPAPPRTHEALMAVVFSGLVSTHAIVFATAGRVVSIVIPAEHAEVIEFVAASVAVTLK